MGMMGSAWICLSCVLLAVCGLWPLCHKTKFSKSSAVPLHHLDSLRLTNSNQFTWLTTSHSFIRNKSQNTTMNKTIRKSEAASMKTR
uniref:Secreted peptide n=1 Tax=Rhipicephalus pulchellus TaxID=72859 RepID=L7LYL4_RHIPC